MSRLFACLLAGAGLLVTVPATPAVVGEGDECARSSWRSTLKKPEKWIIKRESRFSPTAANPISSAFGLGQLLLANRRRYAPQVDADPAGEGYHTGTTDPCDQLRMMRLYIEDRYGSTEKAKKFWSVTAGIDCLALSRCRRQPLPPLSAETVSVVDLWNVSKMTRLRDAEHQLPQTRPTGAAMRFTLRRLTCEAAQGIRCVQLRSAAFSCVQLRSAAFSCVDETLPEVARRCSTGGPPPTTGRSDGRAGAARLRLTTESSRLLISIASFVVARHRGRHTSPLPLRAAAPPRGTPTRCNIVGAELREGGQ